MLLLLAACQSTTEVSAPAARSIPSANLLPGWSPIDLGTLPGVSESQATAINDQDVVVGTSGIDGFFHDGSMHALRRYSAPGFIFEFVDINDINSGKVIVGTVWPAWYSTAYTWPRAMIYSNPATSPTLIPLTGLTANPESYAEAINDAGTVVGEAVFGGLGHSTDPEAYVWSPTGGTRNLHPRGAQGSRAWAIDNQGNIAGAVYYSDGSSAAVRWKPSGGIIYLHALPGDLQAESNDIALGTALRVVGYSGSAPATGVTWTGGATTAAPVPGSYRLYGVSRRDRAAGSAYSATHVRQAFTLRFTVPGSAQILPTIAVGQEAWAVDLNTCGKVAGTARTAAGLRHAVLWKPTVCD
jgi:hypothetical protein